jgi:plastocyanin
MSLEEVAVSRVFALAASLALAVALAVAATASASAAASEGQTLKGTVGPSYKISLTMNGKRVTSLKAGSYTIAVTDRASIHNFVLEKAQGGTFEKELTSVPFMGTKSIKVRLTPGKWEFYCRPHESTMHGDFTVK